MRKKVVVRIINMKLVEHEKTFSDKIMKCLVVILLSYFRCHFWKVGLL